MKLALLLTIVWALMIISAWRSHRSASVSVGQSCRSAFPRPRPTNHTLRRELYARIDRAMKRSRWSAILGAWMLVLLWCLALGAWRFAL